MRRVVILRGLPGSGKSTWAAAQTGSDVFSADHFFITAQGYVFDRTKLPDAHQQCLRKFTWHCQHLPEGQLIVDNTNISVAEIAPYYALAEAYNWRVEVLQFWVPVETAATRNIHSVPKEVIEKMDAAMRTECVPPWWNLVNHK